MNDAKQTKESLPNRFPMRDKKNTHKPGSALRGSFSRRSFLQKGLVAGAGAAAVGLLPNKAQARGGLTPGDAAILRFLAAAEILETDAWQQYNELGGVQDSEVPGGSGNAAYTAALQVLDSDMPQYVHDNTEDEFTHFEFINAYLAAHGMKPADLDPFRTLPSSTATGAQQIGRLTNLMQLSVDTSWWTRYRSSTKNPDFGDAFPQAVPGLMAGEFPAIPRSDADLSDAIHLQAIANTAGFHFAMIEQGGTSLYPSLAQRVTHTEVLRILLSIGPTEAMHFQTWHDKAGNAPPLTDPTNGLVFPDLNSPPFGGEEFSTNLIMPEPTIFLDRKFPICSIVRPTETKGAAMGVVKFLTDTGLFRGQSAEFFAVLIQLAKAADAARLNENKED
ncbi:MAG TPA: twin-arginine translocation signal domain-containing protein [Verrucomicrobiae bacterium]|nr:twin-arginine translocation signal domain-containing protein [Verrucomicrobiae bacterium]